MWLFVVILGKNMLYREVEKILVDCFKIVIYCIIRREVYVFFFCMYYKIIYIFLVYRFVKDIC